MMMNTLFVLGQPMLRRSISSITHSGSSLCSFPTLFSHAQTFSGERDGLPNFSMNTSPQLQLNYKQPAVPWYRITDMPIFDIPPPQPKISELGFPCVDSAQVIDSILDLTFPSDKPNDTPIMAIKRTYQPSVIVSLTHSYTHNITHI
jgi:hypothetical protein